MNVDDLFFEGVGPHWLAAIYCRLIEAGRPDRRERWGEHPRLERAWPDVEGLDLLGHEVGSRTPKLIVVGEKPTDRAPFPFYSRSGLWLWKTLRYLGYDELAVLCTNALTPQGKKNTDRLGKVARVLAPIEPKWLALGREARRVLRKIGAGFAFVGHPQWHSRFKHGEGIDGYAVRMKQAGLPLGPGVDAPAAVDARPPLADDLGVPSGVAYSPANATQRGGKAGRHRPALDAAKRMYVTANAGTVTEAARAAGVDPHLATAKAREEGWHEERDAQRERVDAQAYELAADYEAKKMAQARKVYWANTVAAGASIAQRLKTGELVPSPAEAKALATTAMALSGIGGQERDEALERLLKDHPNPTDLAQRVLDGYVGTFGGERPRDDAFGGER